MKYLSVDLGVRNLAWCVLELVPSKDPRFQTIPYQGSKPIIHAWRLVDITEDESEEVNFQTVDISQCVPWFIKTLRKYWEEISIVDVALIEAQPTGRMLPSGVCINNIRTKVLSHILQALLLDKNIEVRFVSPAKKLKDAIMKDPTKYKDHKKAAVELTNDATQSMDDPWRFSNDIATYI